MVKPWISGRRSFYSWPFLNIGDPLVGDLAERFPSIQDRHGDRFARIWYWRQALAARSVGPGISLITELVRRLRVL
jgi:hypothetical protein